MNINSIFKKPAIPGEYLKIIESLFPAKGPTLQTIAKYAEALGIGEDYQKHLAVKESSKERSDLLVNFQNNLDLLIQKTWVEKREEERKSNLQDDVLPFINLILEGDFRGALETFGAILAELAYLFFGHQSGKDDFTEYTFRIDAQIGLFWWYGSRLGSLKKPSENSTPDNEFLRAILLIGICYLTNF